MAVISLFTCLILLLTIEFVRTDIFVYDQANKLFEEFDDQPGNFGVPVPSKGLKGYVILTKPADACSPVQSPPNVNASDAVWIALIPRLKPGPMTNSCDFDLKAQNAQRANFNAVIIYNYDDELITMGSNGRKISIPSVLIAHSDGLILISKYIYNASSHANPAYYLKITPEQILKLAYYLIPFVVVVSICFLGLIGFILIKCYMNRRRERRHRLPRSALKQLKTKKFVKGDPWEVCAICLDDYEDGAKLRILPCDHAYHMKCIDPWLLNNRRQCPVCKRYVFPNHDHSDDENSGSHGNTTSEQTPLIHPPQVPVIRNRPLPDRRIFPSTPSGAANVSFAHDESSETDEDVSSSQVTTANTITTNAIVFDQPHSQRRRQQHLPRRALRRSSSDENNTTTTTITTYGSVHESPTPFTTPRGANFFVGSLGGTTDNTNISAHSVVEDVDDNEATDNDEDDDERMHSVITEPDVNLAYVSDDETTTLRTNL